MQVPIDRASQTLSRQGLKVRERGPRKSPTTWFSTKVDGWRATVYFDGNGRMNQITVIAETLTKEAAAAAKERLTKRFGAVKDTSFRTERTWGSRFIAPGPWTTLLVARIPDEGWLAREEYGRGESGDPAGAFDLTWGADCARRRAAPPRSGLRSAHARKVPRPVQDAEPAAILRAGRELHRPFQQGQRRRKRGSRQEARTRADYIQCEGRVVCGRHGRAKPIEALRGPASEIADATITTWGNATSDVSLDVRETKAKGTLSAIETYSPAGKER